MDRKSVTGQFPPSFFRLQNMQFLIIVGVDLALLIKLELWAWGLVYQRKDQDVADDLIYEAAEEELARTYVP